MFVGEVAEIPVSYSTMGGLCVLCSASSCLALFWITMKIPSVVEWCAWILICRGVRPLYPLNLVREFTEGAPCSIRSLVSSQHCFNELVGIFSPFLGHSMPGSAYVHSLSSSYQLMMLYLTSVMCLYRDPMGYIWYRVITEIWWLMGELKGIRICLILWHIWLQEILLITLTSPLIKTCTSLDYI
jgi:hypothetical protein